MARQVKEKLDYFPLDTDFFEDIKIKKLKLKHGKDSVFMLIHLYCLIYGDKGYYIEAENAELELMEYFQLDENDVSNFINALIKIGLIDENQFRKNKVLTSKGIQNRYDEIVKKLNRKTTKKHFLVVDYEEIAINSEEIGISYEEMGINSEEMQQRKGKERKRKEKKREEKENAHAREASTSPHSPTLIPFGEFENVFLTETQYQKIQETYCNSPKLIDKISTYLANADKTYRNHFALIKKIATEDNWAKKQVKPNGFNGVDEQKKVKAAPMPEKLREKLKDFKLKGIEEVE